MEQLKTRMFSEEGRDRRILVLDNLKMLRFSWDELEGLLTADIISGKALYIGEGRRPNTLTTCITLNGASLSKDMAQRCIPVCLKRPKYDAGWWERICNFIAKNRWVIIGDILTEFSKPAAKLTTVSRWGAWEADVLGRIANPEQCQQLVAERQSDIDADEEEISIVREAFSKELRDCGCDIDSDIIFIPNKRVADILETATKEKRAVNKASAYLAAVAVPELRRTKRDGRKGWKWVGANASTDTTMRELGAASFIPD